MAAPRSVAASGPPIGRLCGRSGVTRRNRRIPWLRQARPSRGRTGSAPPVRGSARPDGRGGHPCDPTPAQGDAPSRAVPDARTGPSVTRRSRCGKPVPMPAAESTGWGVIDRRHRARGRLGWWPSGRVVGLTAQQARWMEAENRRMNFQGVVMNVTDLDGRSTSTARCSASRWCPEKSSWRPSVLRAATGPRSWCYGRWGGAPCGGARHIGLRAFVLEVETAEQLERIATELDARHALVSRREPSEWTAVVAATPTAWPWS